MKKSSLASIAFKSIVNSFTEEVYTKIGMDHTRPVSVYAIFNEKCNVKCRYCNYWRQDEYNEMSVAEWKAALLSIRKFIGTFLVSFSGGEPFIKPGFIDLLTWCHDNKIAAGVTTNGSALNARNAARVVAARPFNVNISVDAPTADLHDYLRGAPGLFDRLSAGIGHVLNEQAKQRVDFPIVIKPTVNAKNFRVLPDLVTWARQIGATSVSPQPLDRWTPETYNELWIEESDLAEFAAVIERLVEMAGAGEPILTPPNLLRLMPDHFRGKSAPADVMPCRVGTRNFFIRATGDVELCNRGFPGIGNIRHQSAREIWTGDLARQVRRDTYSCERLCLSTCVSQKSLGDKIKMGTKLLRRTARTEAAADAG